MIFDEIIFRFEFPIACERIFDKKMIELYGRQHKS